MDSEQSYKGWTLDVYENGPVWYCDFWTVSNPAKDNVAIAETRETAIGKAKGLIDELIAKEKTQ